MSIVKPMNSFSRLSDSPAPFGLRTPEELGNREPGEGGWYCVELLLEPSDAREQDDLIGLLRMGAVGSFDLALSLGERDPVANLRGIICGCCLRPPTPIRSYRLESLEPKPPIRSKSAGLSDNFQYSGHLSHY
jgi:hypothetical protein